MKKVTHLVCVDSVAGFTVEKKYEVMENGANIVTVVNDFGKSVTFNKVEGENDFKNFFIIA